MIINIAISSNRRFLPVTYSNIVKGLLSAGINKKEIYIFNGHDKTEDNENVKDQENIYDVNIVNLNYNCFDINSMSGILENKLDNCDWWFLLHDTCDVLPEFRQKLYGFDYQQYECVRACNPHCGNIGAYKYSCLEKKKNKIHNLKNYSLSHTQQEFKRRSIDLEDFIFNKSKNCGEFIGGMKSEHVQFMNTPRKAEHYLGIEIIKYKANYKRSETYIVNDLSIGDNQQ